MSSVYKIIYSRVFRGHIKLKIGDHVLIIIEIELKIKKQEKIVKVEQGPLIPKKTKFVPPKRTPKM